MPVTFVLTPSERAEIAKAIRGQGGHQSLLRELDPLVNSHTGDITLSDELIGKIVRYTSYGSGGYQGRLRKAFRRSIDDLLSW